MTDRQLKALLFVGAVALVAFATTTRAHHELRTEGRATLAAVDDDALVRRLLGEPLPGDPPVTQPLVPEPTTTEPPAAVPGAIDPRENSRDEPAEAVVPPAAIVPPGGGDPRESLGETVERMRRAGRRIGDDRDTGEETRDLQRRAVDDLAKLLELARRQQRQQQSSSRPPPPAGTSRPMNDEEPRPGNPAGQPVPMPNDGGTPETAVGEAPGEQRRDDDSNAAESSDVTAQREQREVQLAEQRRLVKDVWGHLPPAVRERMLNAYTDQPLPKYEALVQAYFRALAERSRENGGDGAMRREE